jgi:hypothetical protein
MADSAVGHRGVLRPAGLHRVAGGPRARSHARRTTAIRNRVNGGSIRLADVKTLTNTVRAMSVIEGTQDTASVANVVTDSALAGVMGYVVGAPLLARPSRLARTGCCCAIATRC